MSSQNQPTASAQLPNVYQFAAYLAQRFDCQYVIGVGESAAENLIDFLPELETIGLVHRANLRSFRERYPFGSWFGFDPDNPVSVSLPKHVLQQAIIVCTELGQFERLLSLPTHSNAKIGERLERPEDTLPHVWAKAPALPMLKIWLAGAPISILTTREEDAKAWSNAHDLAKLLERANLNVEFIGRTVTNPPETNHLVAVLTNPSILPSGKQPGLKTPPEFKVCAFMAAYNEEDIIVESIKKWTEQGVSVHVLENWSTDSTFDLLNQLAKELPLTVERFPADGPSPHFDWSAMLKRFERLSQEIKADWFVRRGADEVLMSPWPGVTYRDGLYLVDQAGFNCVDHTVIDFHPVDNGFQPGSNHEAYFRHYSFGTQLSDFHQIKTWKSYGQPVAMADGGHELGFEGRRIYPFKFLLKHYPVRSQLHGERKVFNERKARWNPGERAMGWHIQYDQIKTEHVFVRPRSELIEFDEDRFQTNFVIERLSGIGLKRADRDVEQELRSSLRELKLRLAQRDAQLERITGSVPWRLLRMGRRKILQPAYQGINRLLRPKSPPGSRALTNGYRSEPGASPITRQAINESVFSDIYRRRAWGENYESVSGQGSGIVRTALLRDSLSQLFREINVKTLIDAGCGDFNWMKLVAADLDHYTGIDIVPELILENQNKYGNGKTDFLHLDITTDPLSRADLVLSRDCLVHLSSQDIFRALKNIKDSGSTYLLTNTFVSLKKNTDITTGDWRRVNLQLPPYNFPEPLKLIDENCTHTGGIFIDKRLGLWALKAIHV